MSKKDNGINPGEIFQGIWNILKGSVVYSHYAWKESKYLTRVSKINLSLLLLITIIWSIKNTHFWTLHYFCPDIFTQQFVRNVGMRSWIVQFLLLAVPFLSVVIYVLGDRSIKKIKGINAGFRKAGIKNAEGTHPTVKELTNLTPWRQKLLIDTEGVPAEEFEKKRNFIRSGLNTQIEAIVEQDEPKFIELFLTKKLLSKKVEYANVSGKASKPGEFVVGQTYGRTVTQNLYDLPHLLVAGTTGMGKSYFLRQMVLNLLENTPNLQVFAIDLKEGITMRPFKDLPNVKVVKELSEASEVLEKIRDEMKERFKVLEKEGAEVIDPEKHKRDPILVVIDECSLLYNASKVSDVGRKAAQKASEITDEIAKLSRAARIHLVLGTQKITKETVSTHIQENIEGRVCFKVTSVQGSALVVGTKIARDLPNIKGRAIAKFGVEIDEVQTPFIDKDGIKSQVNLLGKRFEGKKKPHGQPLISDISFRKKVDEGDIDDVATSTEGATL
ncbi:MAG: hypothetical protein KDD22_02160 [Bdellovibrionales bacterium]|nr:hypothetical protein [Bdellovibrionales bacterium]